MAEVDTSPCGTGTGIPGSEVGGACASRWAVPFAPDVYFTNDRPGAMVVFPGDRDPVALVRVLAFICDHIDATRHDWRVQRGHRLGRAGDHHEMVGRDGRELLADVGTSAPSPATLRG